MGNTTSADGVFIDPNQRDAARIEYLSVDFVLDRLLTQSAKETYLDICRSCNLQTKEKLIALAVKIYNRAVADNGLSLEFAELAKFLFYYQISATTNNGVEIIIFKVRRKPMIVLT